MSLDRPTTGAGNPPARREGMWDRFKLWLTRIEQELTFFKGLTIVGAVGTFIATGIVAYFQSVETYESQLSAQYKEDFANGTAAFAEASNALSPALTLQQILYTSFRDAMHSHVENDDHAFITQSDRDIYKSYVDERRSLRQNIHVLARKMELYIDRPSNRFLNVTTDNQLGVDPLTPSTLGAYDFDCDAKGNIPDSRSLESLATVKIKSKTGKPDLDLDWRSAKHQIIALQYCFETTHVALEAARQWAAKSPVDPDKKTQFTDRIEDVQNSIDEQVERFNAFMLLSMRRIEQIRLKYEPNGFWCNLPIVRTGCWLVGLRRG
jgi:hypothetical protein